jgi:quinol-cytochrome oxidoreductase complex cytochrome b subunit
MLESFLGYVLPLRRIRYWGATVIFNLASVLPYGEEIVQLLWSGFFVNVYTLGIVFSIHFLVPFIIIGCVVFHIFFLHILGRTRGIGVKRGFDKIVFWPQIVIQDLMNFIFILLGVSIILFTPFGVYDPEIMVEIRAIKSPIHIQPE